MSCSQPGTSDHPNLTASKGIKISQVRKSSSTAATNILSQSGCPLCIGEDIRSCRSSGSLRASQSTIATAKPKKSAMNAHPAGHSSVPAETKSSAANTANSASTSKSAFPKSAFRFIAHLHKNSAHRFYSEPPPSEKIPSRASVNSVRCAKHAEREEHSVVAHQATHQGGLQAPLQPLERLDPPAQRAPSLRADLDAQLEARHPHPRVANRQRHRVPRAEERQGMGNAGDARRGDVDREAAPRPGDGVQRRGNGDLHDWSGGAALGVLARDGRLLRTPPRRTCVTFREGANIREHHFHALGWIEKGPMRWDHREPVHRTWLVAVLLLRTGTTNPHPHRSRRKNCRMSPMRRSGASWAAQ